ncbi:MAG TPA: hypothetical protein VGR91_00480 [Stellaceae bacterium]|nr:hypothetical protein [Stellaceae bacterium]
MTDEEEAREEAAAPAPRRRAMWVALWLALLLAIVLGGVGSTPYWAAQVTPLLPWASSASPSAAEYSRLAARIGTLEAGSRAAAAAAASVGPQSDKAIAAAAAHLRTLDKRVTAIEAKESATPTVDPAQIAALQKELAQLAGREKQAPPPAAAAPPPPAALPKLEQQIAALEARSQSRAEQLRAEIAKLKAEETRLDAMTAGLADRVPALAAELHAHRAAGHADAALFLGLLQLREAFADGRPFPQEYKTFLTLVRDWPDLADAAKPLAEPAKTGVASRVALLRRLAELAGRIVARKPLPAKQDWRSRLAAEVAALVKIRHIDEKGAPGPQASVNAAQLALAHGDLAGAVKALEPLSGPAAEAARPWLDLARQRLQAETALAHLQDLMVRRLVGPAAVPAAPAAPEKAAPATPKKPGAPS